MFKHNVFFEALRRYLSGVNEFFCRS